MRKCMCEQAQELRKRIEDLEKENAELRIELAYYEEEGTEEDER